MDNTPPLLADVRAEAVLIRPGLIKHTSAGVTKTWILTADGVKTLVGNVTCPGGATVLPSPDAFIDPTYSMLFNEFVPVALPFQSTYAFKIYHGYSTLRSNVSVPVDITNPCRSVSCPLTCLTFQVWAREDLPVLQRDRRTAVGGRR